MAPMSARKEWTILIAVSIIPLIPLLTILYGVLWFIVQLNSQGLYGYVNNQGQFVIPPKFSSAQDFKNGQASVAQEVRDADIWGSCKGTWKLKINQQGQLIQRGYFEKKECYSEAPDKYDAVPDYINGSDFYPAPMPDSTRTQGGFYKIGYIDKNNKWVLPPQFAQASNFHNDVAWVKPFIINKHCWGLINKKGKYVLEPKCLIFGNFHEGLARCRVKMLFGMFY